MIIWLNVVVRWLLLLTKRIIFDEDIIKNNSKNSFKLKDIKSNFSKKLEGGENKCQRMKVVL